MAGASGSLRRRAGSLGLGRESGCGGSAIGCLSGAAGWAVRHGNKGRTSGGGVRPHRRNFIRREKKGTKSNN
jgi:hypothetical protein